MPALVAVMIMVSIGTFSWASFKSLSVHPKSTSLVMVATVVVVVWTHNLALGVGVGVLFSALSFAREGAEVEIIGRNEASATIVDRLALHDRPGALERLLER